MIKQIVLLGLFLSPCICSVAAQQKVSDSDNPIIAGYLAEKRLKSQDFTIKAMEKRGTASRLTHLIYAFADIFDGLPRISNEELAYKQRFTADQSVDGNADTMKDNELHGAFNQLRKLKEQYLKLKVLISIGGAHAANAKGFSLVSRTKESRRRFVAACVDLFLRGNLPGGVSAANLFDGIDIDWEYPIDCGGCAPEDKANLALLLAEFRRQLNEESEKKHKQYELTIASSPWIVDDYDKYEWTKINPLLNFINVMSYDLAPPGKTRPHSPLFKSSVETGRWSETFNTDYVITRYLQAGLPANKLVMGVPFYGRGWRNVANVNDGLYQKTSDWAIGSWGEGRESYRRLKKLMGFRLFRDAETKALWIFNSNQGIFWSYDDPESLRAKMKYVKTKGLGGVTFWELTGDDDEGSLVKAIYRGLH